MAITFKHCVTRSSPVGIRPIAAALSVATLLALPGCATKPPTTVQDWRAIAAADLDATHRAIQEMHPGMIDDLNPGFRDWVDAGYREAFQLLPRVVGYDDALAVVRYYTGGFQDGHLVYSDDIRSDPDLTINGWKLNLIDGEYVVIATASKWNAPLPSVRSRLVGCDGLAAEALIRERSAPFSDRRKLPASQERAALSLLFLPLAGFELKHCQFRNRDATLTDIDVTYQSVSFQEAFALGSSTTTTSRRTNSFQFEDGVLWIHAANFMPSPAEASELDLMLKNIEQIEGVKPIVFDSRGNRGGDSGVGDRIFEAATGGLKYDENNIDSLPRTFAQWRVTDTAISRTEGDVLRYTSLYGERSQPAAFMRDLLEKLKLAKVRGEPWVEQDTGPRATSAETVLRGGKLRRFSGKMALVTDQYCASACLDFSDLVHLVPGSVHVGKTASADTVYIDVANVALPSGNHLVLPLKVWRNRARGNNEPWVPDVNFDFDITDDNSVRKATLTAMEHAK